MNTSCPSCRAPLSPEVNFCSQCGMKIKESPFRISPSKQALVYFVSFFLAPFGLAYVVQYLRLKDRKARAVGVISLVLTIAAIALVLTIGTVLTKFYYGFFDTLLF